MFEKKEEKITFGIKPVAVFINIIGVVGSIITITLAIIYLNTELVIISILALALIFLLVFLVIMFRRLKEMKDEYNELIIDYNDLVNAHNFANENRDTLQGMVEDKNDELAHFKFEMERNKSIINVLWFFYSSKPDEKPDRQELKNAMQIENGQVINDEKQRI